MRDDRERLLDIVEMCDNLSRYVVDGGRERMDRDPTVLAAAERWVEVLGAAARTISAELRAAHPEVPWQDVVGMRTILAHGYFHIDAEILWQVAYRDAPTIRTRALAMLDGPVQDRAGQERGSG